MPLDHSIAPLVLGEDEDGFWLNIQPRNSALTGHIRLCGPTGPPGSKTKADRAEVKNTLRAMRLLIRQSKLGLLR